MREEKPNQREKLKIPLERLEKYFAAGTTLQQMEETVIKALDFYRQRQRERRDRDAR